jgi:Putative Zn-dependent protease, contains TPR repeats
MSHLSSPISRRSRARLLAAFLALATPFCAFAQDAARKPELSEKAHQAIQVISPLMDKDPQPWDEILEKIEPVLQAADPESYDKAYLSQLKVQALLNKSNYGAAIEPLETAVGLSEKHGYFGNRDLELLWLLAQLYGQEASAAGEKNIEAQRSYYAKAYDALRRWSARTPKTNPDAQYFMASILYNQALYDNKVDKELLRQAQIEAEKGLSLSIKPREHFYALLVSMAQQLGDNVKAAEYLELLVRDYPKNKSYWQSLLNAYLLQEEKGFVPAIITLERAQSHGLLNEKGDNFTLVGIHLNAQQYSHAADLFEAGLRNGSLESSQRNWELLANCYQQLRKDDKAIATLKEATKLFPDSGALEVLIGNLYYMADRYAEALTHFKQAVAKKLEKSQQVQAYSYIAYLALELKFLDEAKAAADKVIEIDPETRGAKELLKAVNDALEERDAQLKAPTVTS